VKKALILVSFLLFASILLLAAATLRPFGEPTATDMDDYFIANSQGELAANNAVTAVVFDYRGFDTLGEATVLYAAVVGVLIAFRALRKEER